MLVSLSSRLLIRFVYIKFHSRSMFVNKSSLLIIVCSGRTYRPYQRDLALFSYHFWRAFGCICGSDRVVGDSSYCEIVQCETPCRGSIVQCEHSRDWILPQIVMQCENNGDPTSLKIVQCELGIKEVFLIAILLCPRSLQETAVIQLFQKRHLLSVSGFIFTFSLGAVSVWTRTDRICMPCCKFWPVDEKQCGFYRFKQFR